MIKIEFSKLKQVISMTQHFYVEAWCSMVEVYWTLDGTILMSILWMISRQFTPRKITRPPLGLGLRLVLGWGWGGGQFSLGATVLEPLWIYQEQMEEHIKCRHIMYIPSNFWIFQGSEYAPDYEYIWVPNMPRLII